MNGEADPRPPICSVIHRRQVEKMKMSKRSRDNSLADESIRAPKHAQTILTKTRKTYGRTQWYRPMVETRVVIIRFPENCPYVHPSCVNLSRSSHWQRYLRRSQPEWHRGLVTRDTFDEFWGDREGKCLLLDSNARHFASWTVRGIRGSGVSVACFCHLLCSKNPEGYRKHLAI